MIVLFFSDIAWDSLRQRPQHLATRLARCARVLWVEPATLGRRLRFRPREDSPGIFRMTLPAFPLNARVRWIRASARVLSGSGVLRSAVAALQRALLARGLRAIQGPGEGTVCLVENFLMMHLARTMRARRVVFDYIDDAFGFTSLPPFVHEEWLGAVRSADEVTVTSPTLRTRIIAAHARKIRLVPNGAEVAHFATPASAPRPADLPPEGTIIVGYTGSVYPWLDFALLEEAAGQLQDFHFVLIGQMHPEVATQMARLARRRNFSYLGAKPYAVLPAYVQRFSAGIIPFRRTLLTEAVNPVKLYEYAAAGVPAVVTDFSDDTRALAEIVLIASSPGQFVEHLRTAVRRRGDPSVRDALTAFARAHDWEERAREFSALLQLTDRTP